MGIRRSVLLITIAFISVSGFAAGQASPDSAGGAGLTPRLATPKVVVPDVSTRAAAESYFRSKGIDPATVTYQTGLNNYAGPSCPGAAWSCVTANGPVWQMSSSSSGSNSFTCTPSTTGTSSPDTCVVVQSAASGTNTAKCVESTTTDNLTLQCNITQTNTTGKNSASVTQTSTESAGLSQTETQYAAINQTNASGDNVLALKQTVNQTIGSGGPLQAQEALQSAFITQHTTGSGDNSAEISQSQKQRESFSGSTAIEQRQNASGSISTRNVFAQLDQTSDGGGSNEAESNQKLDQGQTAKAKTASITQTQGYDDGGIEAQIDQSSSGESHADANQEEKQKQSAKTTGLVTQTQVGPVRCCSDQTGNPENKFEISQEAEQSSGPGATQSEDVRGECHSSGKCEVKQSVEVQGVKTNNSCTGTDCDIAIFCEGVECFTSSGSD